MAFTTDAKIVPLIRRRVALFPTAANNSSQRDGTRSELGHLIAVCQIQIQIRGKRSYLFTMLTIISASRTAEVVSSSLITCICVW